MFKKFIPSLFVAIILIYTFGSNVIAGPYSNELSKCIIDSTTPKDRNDFVVWMFTAIAQHPSVKDKSNISQKIADESTRKTAKIFERLMTEDCKNQTVQVINYEGLAELENSFQILGQVAAQELFQNPDVAQSLANLEKHFDIAKLENVLKLKE